VPGCAKAPGALRDHGLLDRLGARDAGCLTPPRYDPGDWRPGDGVCHAVSIAAYSKQLADRIAAIIDAGEFPVVLGGDCSIVLGSALAMNRLGEDVGGRIGLVFVDGHSDFRHPGNASYVGAAAGEDLALVTGRGQPDLAAIEGRRPYFRDIDVVVLGIRGHDEYRLDLQAAGIVTRPVPALRAEGAARTAQWARDQLVDCAGYWVHVDVDVLDPAVMPAVDAPEPGGIAFPELELLLAGLVDTPHCLGVEITVFDPDYDTDGTFAEEITAVLVAGLAPVRAADAPPRAARNGSNHPVAPEATRARTVASGPIAPPSTVARSSFLASVIPQAAFTPTPAAAAPDAGSQDHVDDEFADEPGQDRADRRDRADGSAQVDDEPAHDDSGRGQDGQADGDPAEDDSHGHDGGSPGDTVVPVGVRPLLESEHLPVSAPGKLRPRSVDAFTLPIQRPAFEPGPVTPADHP
jgi:arginase